MSAAFAKTLFAAMTATDFADRAANVYFESLRNRYGDIRRGVDPSGSLAQAAIDMNALEDKASSGSVSMSDALRYERLAVRCATDESVPAILRSVRSHYRRFCTPAEYRSYLQGSGDPKGNDAREEIDTLLGKIQDSYVLSPFREKVRSQLTMRISFALIICTAGILALCEAVAWFGWGGHQFPWWLVFAAISGAAGGLVSVHFRIQSLTVAGDAIRGALALCNGWFSVYFSPVIGAIAAVLLALLFRGGLISGELFPDFDTAGAAGEWNGKQLAKLLVWSFIAGFIERLVPDTLTRLSDAVGGYRFPQQAEQDRSLADTTALIEDRRRLNTQDPRVDGSTQHVEPQVATPATLPTETTPQAASQ